jgi:nitrate/nitrite-specific signal transduction histidine kinase
MSHRIHETVSSGDRRPAQPAGSVTGVGDNSDQKTHTLEDERSHLRKKILEVQSEQQHLLERYVGLEEQNSNLTSLYVACQRLHSSLDLDEVLLTVREIMTNLVGCEEYVLFKLTPDGWLRRVDSLGVDPKMYGCIPRGNGLIGRTVETGIAYLLGESDESASTQMDAHLTACIPLKRNGAVTGAVALFRLLPQKQGLQELDRELFWLLQSHLEMALYCAELHQRWNAKNGARA